MKKLIPLILITFLWVGTASAYITAEERKKFDNGLKRIEARKTNYNYKKQADKRRIERQREQKKAKLRRKKQLENVAKRNYRLAIEHIKRNDANRFNNLRNGECILSELTGNKICK